jgi:hypothetical protein
MTEKVEFTLEAHDAGAVRAWQALAREIASYQRELAQIDDAERKNAQAAQAHERAARRIIEGLLTPQQRYQRQLEQLNLLRQQNRLTEEQYAAAVRQTQRDFEQQAGRATSGVGQLTSRLAGLAAGYVSVTAAVRGWMDANRQAIEEAEQAAAKADEQARRFAVQAGLRELEGRAADQRILAVAEETGVSSDFARKAATQLVSSGFSVSDASGDALRHLLQGLAASNLLDQDPTQLTQALGQFLAATGQEKTSDNLRQALVGAQRLFKATDLQVSDLSQLAGKVQGLAGVMSPAEVLATFDVLREKTGADQAATAVKIFGDRLRGAREDRQRVDVLRQLRLRPEDVDLLGEDVQTVLDRLAAGLERVAPERRAGLIQKLFGTEASSPIEGLLRDRAEIGKALETMADTRGFAEDVAIATGGRAAAARRQAVARERRAVTRDDLGDLVGEELQARLEALGQIAFQRTAAAGVYHVARTVGVSPLDAAWLGAAVSTQGLLGGGVSAITADVKRGVERKLAGAVEPPAQAGRRLAEETPRNSALVGALEQNTQAVRQLAEETRRNSADTRKNTQVLGDPHRPNTAPAPLPRAAARR